MFRESSSVFRASCGFGCEKGGGSNPSSPTNLTPGTHTAPSDKRRKRASIQSLEKITVGARLGIHDLVGGSIPLPGTYCGGSIRHVCGCKHSPLRTMRPLTENWRKQ